MYEIETRPIDPQFAACWRAAGHHLQASAKGAELIWLKARLEPPFLEHLSFRLGNQLFFVRLEDDADLMKAPGSRDGLLAISKGCAGHACVMPMEQGGEEWRPRLAGWGLVDCRTGAKLNPPQMTTNQPIEMTDWEVHDFAVQMVRQSLEKEGRDIMSSQGNPSVDPSLWFVGDEGPEWVVVRAIRYPERDAEPPRNLREIAASCRHLSQRGHFASVAVASAEDAFEADHPATPLWRGRGMYVSYDGMRPYPSL